MLAFPLHASSKEHLSYVLVRITETGLMKFVLENGCYRLYAENMLMGIIKQYIADLMRKLSKWEKSVKTCAYH